MSDTPATPSFDLAPVWTAAIPYAQFVAEVRAHHPLWEAVYRTAAIPGWARERASRLAQPARLIAIVEGWCGDGGSTVPVLAKLADETRRLELRVLRRDEHPEVMDRYLTNGARSIPIVVALDEAGRERGHWGPRPAELQAWVMAHKDGLSKEERFREVRRWYARDRGQAALREILDLVD
jgi:thioredoxin-like negative regulator of GroEL